MTFDTLLSIGKFIDMNLSIGKFIDIKIFIKIIGMFQNNS